MGGLLSDHIYLRIAFLIASIRYSGASTESTARLSCALTREYSVVSDLSFEKGLPVPVVSEIPARKATGNVFVEILSLVILQLQSIRIRKSFNTSLISISSKAVFQFSCKSNSKNFCKDS